MYHPLKYTAPETEVTLLQSEGSVCQPGSFNGVGLEHLTLDSEENLW